MLTGASILKIANPNEDFIICTHACKEGISGILTWNGHVIFYKSKKLKENEKNYATHDLELVSIVHTLKM